MNWFRKKKCEVCKSRVDKKELVLKQGLYQCLECVDSKEMQAKAKKMKQAEKDIRKMFPPLVADRMIGRKERK